MQYFQKKCYRITIIDTISNIKITLSYIENI